MEVNLTQGAITRICGGYSFSSDELTPPPVLQLFDLNLLTTAYHCGTRKYGVTVSDGSHYQQGTLLLAPQKNEELVDSGKLQNGSIVRLTQFTCNCVSERMIIVIVELDILKEKCDLIGEPVPAPKCSVKIQNANAGGVTAGSVYPKDVSTWITTCNIVKSSLEQIKKEFEFLQEKIKHDEEKIGSLIAEKEGILKLLEGEQEKKELVEKISDSLKAENECVRSMLFETAKEAFENAEDDRVRSLLCRTAREAFDNAVGQLKILNPELKEVGASSERVARDGKICVVDIEGNFVPCPDVHPSAYYPSSSYNASSINFPPSSYLALTNSWITSYSQPPIFNNPVNHGLQNLDFMNSSSLSSLPVSKGSTPIPHIVEPTILDHSRDVPNVPGLASVTNKSSGLSSVVDSSLANSSFSVVQNREPSGSSLSCDASSSVTHKVSKILDTSPQQYQYSSDSSVLSSLPKQSAASIAVTAEKLTITCSRQFHAEASQSDAQASEKHNHIIAFGVLRNPREQVQYVGGVLPGPMQSTGNQDGIQRNSRDGVRWQRSPSFQQRGLIPSPTSQTPFQMLYKAEEVKQRQLKGILNRITTQNFYRLFEQVKAVNIDNAVTLTGLISQIYEKALMEPTVCEMYANFCLHLASELPDFSVDNEKITFRRLLVNKCQEEFERGGREQEVANKVNEGGGVNQSDEERESKRVMARKRRLGNIRLIGELYKKRMLTERIMHECIKKLLGDQYQDPDEEDVEALCELMSTVGEMIDHPRAKTHMDAYFERMKLFSDNMKLSARVRCMLKDVIDLRSKYFHVEALYIPEIRGWVS